MSDIPNYLIVDDYFEPRPEQQKVVAGRTKTRAYWQKRAETAEAALSQAQQARDAALEEAVRAIDKRRFEKPENSFENGYNLAIDQFSAAIRAKKKHSTAEAALPSDAPEAQQ